MLKYLNELNQSKIIIHPLFIKDIENLLKRDLRGQEKEFWKLFLRQVSFIDQFPVQDLYRYDHNEKLKYNNQDIYSLHLQTKVFNLRILAEPRSETIVLLVMFNEKSGKRRTNYSYQLKKLGKRLEEMNCA